MIIDTQKVKLLLEDKSVSYDHINHSTGISKGTLRRYRTGESQISNMTIATAKKLQDMYHLLQEKEGNKRNIQLKIKGIKKAVGELNNCEKQARIYFDKNKMEVWTQVYPDESTAREEYHDSSIVEIKSKSEMVTRKNDYITMRQLQEICEEHL